MTKYYVNDILLSKTPLSLGNQSEDFELYSSTERELMKIAKHTCRVTAATAPGKTG